MKCPKCGNELEEGKLLCEKCGEEIKIVPDYDIELETELKESISSMLKDLDADESLSDDVDDDIKDELSDYFPTEVIHINVNKKYIKIVAVVVTVIIVVAVATGVVKNYINNSFEYQYDKAIQCAAQNDYTKAVNYLERALAIESEDYDARFLLAKYYDKNGQRQSTISLLKEILYSSDDYSKRDEVYDMLLSIYESQSDYETMGEILKSCDIQRIVSKYNKYAAIVPEFNKQGGVYDELISISLKGNSEGFVYYTIDGTNPTSNSHVYETPILLESGEYVIKAMFVNMYGVESDVITHNYYINLSQPKQPTVNLDSGTYNEPALIEAYHDDNTKIYYTIDGSIPDKNSKRYVDAIEMPYGISNFSFVAIDESGLNSEIVNRTYHLSIQANFSTELALQVLKNNLWADGTLLNAEGNVADKLGINQYRVQTLYKENETLYYIVYEEYIDTLGKTHNTNNIYAIDVNTADLYKAYKMDEGKYRFSPFIEK